jgi:CHAT domain-containing protein
MVRHICLACSFGLILCAGAQPDDPQSKTEPKPQWQRMLTGEDARKAAELQKRIADLEAADKYAEAIQLREELIALRTKVQGVDHWETVNERWALTALKKVAVLPKENRADWRKAVEEDEEGRRLEQKAHYANALPLRQEYMKSCQQVLGTEDPETARCYNNVAFNLSAQGKYAEAGPLLQKALEILGKALGEKHPETAAIYDNSGMNLHYQGKCAEAEPLYQKALHIRREVLGEEHPHTARSYNSIASALNHQGKYAEAGALYQKALNILRKSVGEKHPVTATVYNNVASNLGAQGKYAEAGPLYQKALDIQGEELGEEHPDTAGSLNNLATNLGAQGKYAEAGPLLQRALDSLRKVLGEEHPNTAVAYDNLAANLSDQGQYAEADALSMKALAINRKVLGEWHASTAQSYNNVAANMHLQGKYAEAEALFQKSLDIRRKVLGNEHPDTAESYNNLATNLNYQRKYAAAGPLLQTALKIRRKVLGEEHPNTSQSYNNVAGNLDYQGKNAEAAPLRQKALNIWRKVSGEQHPLTAMSYHCVASNLYGQSKHAEALETLERAVGSYEGARQNVATSGLERASFGVLDSPYSLLAAARRRAGRSADAWAALEADLARGLLDEMAFRRGSGRTPSEQRRRDELEAKQSPINYSILALVSRAKRTDAEAEELEDLLQKRQKLEKALIKLAITASQREMATLAQLQAALPSDAAFIAWVDISGEPGGIQEHLGCVVRDFGDPHWERLRGTGPGGQWTNEDGQLSRQFREALGKLSPAPEIEALAKQLHAQRIAPLSKHLGGVKQLFVAPVRWMADIPVEVLSDKYTISYTPSGTYLARLKDRVRPQTSAMLAVGDPVFPPVKESLPPTTLPPGGLLITYIVPGGNAANARLHSGDVLVAYAGEDLKSLEQLDKLLAANTDAKSVVVKVWREGQEKTAEREVAPGRLGVALAKEPARQAITARRQTDQMLAKLRRGESLVELPGTQVEITRLAGLFDAKNVTALTRGHASEQRLEEMRKADKLKQFRYLHFATHGKANNFRSFDSALILTRPDKVPEPRAGQPWLDGRLTAAEVLEYWKLDAELVTLSACESALGRPGGGDGLLGFAQAFLLAGSRSVCLTLWQVDDTATALLMDRFYRNLLGERKDGAKPMGKAAALHEAKQWLRNLSAKDALERLGTLTNGVVRGERPAREVMKTVPIPKDAGKDNKPYAHPRYWAAFILIGDPE